jgi:U6 snRNA-associated Sm-like protein LSm6
MSEKPFSQVLRSPGDFLKQVIGQSVVVRLHSGVDYQGKHRFSFGVTYWAGRLVCLDGYMNIALEQAEEWVGGIRHRTYGDAFIRGNNGKLLGFLAPSHHV